MFDYKKTLLFYENVCYNDIEVGGQMKKIIILLSVFLLVGCTNSLSSTLSIDTAITTVLKEGNNNTNINGRGYKYYKPRDFSVLDDNLYNHVLLSNGVRYYLNIDINSYYNKYKESYEIDSSLYYSNRFYFNNNMGYIEIKKGNNDYFYVKMMYNYSNIEVAVEERNIKNAVINSAIILSSIRYNDKVIDSLISNGDLNVKETTYEMKKPPKEENNKNILEVIDYGEYEE